MKRSIFTAALIASLSACMFLACIDSGKDAPGNGADSGTSADTGSAGDMGSTTEGGGRDGSSGEGGEGGAPVCHFDDDASRFGNCVFGP